MATNYLNATAEVILPGMRRMFNDPTKFKFLFNKFKGVKPEMINERDFRAPYLKRDIGRFGTYNPDGGGLGRGRAADTGVLIGSFFSFRLNTELSELAVKSTSDSRISSINAFKEALKSGMPNFAMMIDKSIHGDGTAVLGTATAVGTWSGGTKTVFTMDATTGTRGIQRGLGVIVYQNDLSASRDTGTVRFIEQVEEDAGKVYLDGLVGSVGATDKLVFEGVSGASPAGPYGIYMYNTTSTSGTLHGATRTNELALNPIYVDGLGSPTPLKMMQAVHKMLDRWKEKPEGMEFLCSTTQQANMWKFVQNLAIVDLSKSSINNEIIDSIPDTWTWGTAKMRLDLHQRTDRIDGIVTSQWVRTQLPSGEIDFFKTPGTAEKFYSIYAADGSPAATTWFALTTHMNVMNTRPGFSAFIGNLSASTY